MCGEAEPEGDEGQHYLLLVVHLLGQDVGYKSPVTIASADRRNCFKLEVDS